MANDSGDDNKKLPPQEPPAGEKSPASGKRPEAPRRNSRAGIVWLLILLVLGSLALFKGYDSDKVRRIDQTAFEKLLEEGRVATARMTSENDRIFTVEGELRPSPVTAKAETKQPSAAVPAPGGAALRRSRALRRE